MGLDELLQWNISLFVLILARVAGIVMLSPVFGARGVPRLVKLGLAVSFTIIFYPLVAAGNPGIPTDLLPFVALLIKETVIGLVIGFVVYTFTAVLEGAGQLIDIGMGFSMGATLDPVYGTRSSLIGGFQVILATMILLATNAHHYLIAAMIRSYEYIPINTTALPSGASYYVDLVANVFALSIQIALPVFGALILADVGVGLLSRTVPQLNIFAIIFPVKIIFGFALLLISLPLFGESVSHLFKLNMNWVLELYQGWSQ